MRKDGNIRTFLYTHIHTLWMCTHKYNMMRERENERSVLCVILCCVRITRNRHGLRGKGLADTQDITRHELE